jgi:protein-tyrosine phosphatase
LPGSAADLPRNINTVIDLCAELPCPAVMPGYVSAPALDLIALHASALESVVQRINDAVLKGPVLVCCALGYSRSAAAVAAWLIASGRAANAREAVARIRQARLHTVLSARQCQALDALARPRER